MILLKNKRGLSEIVSTVLIILLTIAVAAFIFSIVVPLVNDNLQKSTECTDYAEYFNFVEEYEVSGEIYRLNCYSNGMYGLSIEAKKNIPDGVKGFLVSFSNEKGLTKTARLVEGEKVNNFRMFEGVDKIAIPKAGNSLTYVYNSSEKMVSAEIYPILNSGRVCEGIADKITFIPCESNVNFGGMPWFQEEGKYGLRQ